MTQRLLSSAAAHWAPFDGWAASRGVEPLDLPIDRFLSLAWYWLTKGATSNEQVKKLEARLWRPPPGEAAPAVGPWSAQAETDAFQAFTAEFNGKK